jgi:hypothetical protein
MLRIESMHVAIAGAFRHGEIHWSRWLRSFGEKHAGPPGKGGCPGCNRTKHDFTPREHGQSSE